MAGTEAPRHLGCETGDVPSREISTETPSPRPPPSGPLDPKNSTRIRPPPIKSSRPWYAGAAPRQIAARLTPGDVRLLLEAQVFLPDRVGTGGGKFLGMLGLGSRKDACVFLPCLLSLSLFFLSFPRRGGCWFGVEVVCKVCEIFFFYFLGED